MRFTSKLLLETENRGQGSGIRIAAIFLLLAATAGAARAQVDQIDPTSQIQWNLGVVTALPNCTQNGQYATFPYGAQWGQHAIVSSTNVEWSCTPTGWITDQGCNPNTIANGCTGATTAAGALANLGIGVRQVDNYAGATFGDKLAACLAEIDVPLGGGMCDATYLNGTSNGTTGAIPMQIIGKNAKVDVILPGELKLSITQTETDLATPSIPTVTATTASGTMPAFTYYTIIDYEAGGGKSAGSAEQTTVLGANGCINVTSPVQDTAGLALEYGIYIATSSGAELQQWVGPIGTNHSFCSTPSNNAAAPFLSRMPAPLSAPNGLPVFLVNASTNSGFYALPNGTGAELLTTSTTNVSNIVSTYGRGAATIENLWLHANSGGTVSDSVLRLSGVYYGSHFSGNTIYLGANEVGFNLVGALNDITLESSGVGGEHATGAIDLVAQWGCEWGDCETFGSVDFHNFVFTTPGDNEPMATFTAPGNLLASSYMHGLSFDNVSLENSSGSANALGLVFQNVADIQLPFISTYTTTGAREFVPVTISSDTMPVIGRYYTDVADIASFRAANSTNGIVDNVTGATIPMNANNGNSVPAYHMNSPAAGSYASTSPDGWYARAQYYDSLSPITEHASFINGTLGTESGGTNYGSSSHVWQYSYQSTGGPAQTGSFSASVVPITTGANPGANLNYTVSSSDSGALGYIFNTKNEGAWVLKSSNAMILQPLQDAVLGTNYISPHFEMKAFYWNGAASQSTTCQWQNKVGSGSPPTTNNYVQLYCDGAVANQYADIQPPLNLESTLKFGSGTPASSTDNTGATIVTATGGAITESTSGMSAGVTGIAANATGTPGVNAGAWTATSPEYWSPYPEASSAGVAFTQNDTVYFSFSIPFTMSIGHITYALQTADNTSTYLYDLGIYNIAGVRLAHTGAVAGSVLGTATGAQDQAFTSAVVLTPGTYLLAGTSNCTATCAVLRGPSGAVAYSRYATTGNTTTSGLLLASGLSVTGRNVGGLTSSVWWFSLAN